MDKKEEGLMKIFFTLLLLVGVPASASLLDVHEFELLAIQDGGRVKPVDTFSRESVQLLTGVQIYQGKNPTELMLSWLFIPDQWTQQKFIQIKHLQLKKDLGIPEDQSFVSPSEIVHNAKLPSLFTQLNQLQRDKKKLNPYFSALARLNSQLTLFQDIVSGQGLRLMPQRLSQDWLSIAELKDRARDSFTQVALSYFAAVTKKDPNAFSQAVGQFKKFARSEAPSVYPSEQELKAEFLYNNVHPFRLAYIVYLLAAIVFVFSLKFAQRIALWRGALALTFLGWIIHVVGFAFRCYIAGRPPVSNMYESVIWVSLGCLTFGLIFELIYKRRYIGLAACSMATIGLIIGDSVPAVLDQSIKPLEPVLRSNYWLIIHVLTITLSYAAFALATGIGNIALYYYGVMTEVENKERLQALALFCYRAMQVGVLLLTAGTILGGVWADYSWGRFWGWDPKETWALIADLGYLAILHGRFSGWLRIFGTLAAAVCCFTGVIMAWYGVNFVLGAGLHSYGFGGGGVQYVSVAVLLQLAYVGWAGLGHRKFLQLGNG